MASVEGGIQVSLKGYACASYNLSKKHARLSQQVFITTYH